MAINYLGPSIDYELMMKFNKIVLVIVVHEVEVPVRLLF